LKKAEDELKENTFIIRSSLFEFRLLDRPESTILFFALVMKSSAKLNAFEQDAGHGFLLLVLVLFVQVEL
jgi:hypothetical protein